MAQAGAIRLVTGLILVLGAVGGMEDPSKADALLLQLGIAVVGLGLMFWGTVAVNRQTRSTLDQLYKR
jgi:hypothetical protein